MTRRLREPLNGARYCADVNEKQIHDLDTEKLPCRIEKIIKKGNAKPYWSLVSAHIDGFVDCKCCMGALESFCEDVPEAEYR